MSDKMTKCRAWNFINQSLKKISGELSWSGVYRKLFAFHHHKYTTKKNSIHNQLEH